MRGEASGRHDERRQHERVYRKVPVRFGPALELSAFAHDISEGGLHVVTNDVAPVGSRLALEVELGDYSCRHECEVMWAIRVPEHLTGSLVYGMGVRILHPPVDWSRRFRTWKQGLGDTA